MKNIFVYNALNASKCKLNENDSYLHSLLIHLENLQETKDNKLENFATEVLDAINLSNAFYPIDRVCLALTYPNETKIRILSVANSNKISKNLMPIKYSCFVSKGSSLLKTKSSNVRIYSDIEDIIARYGEGIPVQRSLRLIREMGIKSGITIPLTISNSFSGFLFLNSVETKTFDNLKPEDYSTLCLLKMIASSYLQRNFINQFHSEIDFSSDFNKISEVSNSFSQSVFQKLLEITLIQKYEKEITVLIHSSITIPFFISVKPLISLIIKACDISGYLFTSNKIEIEIELNPNEDCFSLDLKMKDLKLSEQQIKKLQNLKLFSDHDVFLEKGYLVLRSEVELKKRETIDYSF
jgi:transcriptional regulator with GAF, ATPase, and Fis domain